MDKQGVNVTKNPSHEAIEWFISIESGGLRNPATCSRWDAWRAKPGNSLEYISVIELVEQLRTLRPPVPARRKDLLRDAAKGDD